MKFIEITDCNNNLHLINSNFIYKLTVIEPFLAEKRHITCIHLNHKDNDYTFETIKTFENISTLRSRLATYNDK